MTQAQPSWIARLLAGAELQQAEEQVRQAGEATRQAREQADAQDRARADAQATLEQLRARLEAVETELKVRTDIMNLTSIVSEADKKGDILSINEKFLEVSKYSRDELIGHGHNTTRHPDMPKEVFKQMWATIGRGQIFRGVVKNRAKDGTPYYVDAVIAPILGDNGKPRKYLGVRYDITAAELERHNARGILDAIDSAYAYAEFDLQGHVLHANRNLLTLLGHTIEEVKGRHHRMFVDPAEAMSADYANLWRDLAEGKSRSQVYKRITHGGEPVWIQAVYAPVKDEMGRVVKIVKIATDVTAQVKASNMLKDAVAQAQEVTAAARDGAATVEDVQVVFRRAQHADATDLRDCDALLVATSENFGAVAGMTKDFFERVFYPCEHAVAAKPYAVIVCAGTDGTGAMRDIDRIATGLRMKKVLAGVTYRSGVTAQVQVIPADVLQACATLGATLAAGVAAGIY